MRISFALAALAAFATCTPLSSTPTPGSALTQIDAMSTSDIASDDLFGSGKSDDAQMKVKGSGEKQAALREALDAFLKSILDNESFLEDTVDQTIEKVREIREEEVSEALTNLQAAVNHMDSGVKGSVLKFFGHGKTKAVNKDDPAFKTLTLQYDPEDAWSTESAEAIKPDLELLFSAMHLLPGREYDAKKDALVIKKKTPMVEKQALDRIKFILAARAEHIKV